MSPRFKLIFIKLGAATLAITLLFIAITSSTLSQSINDCRSILATYRNPDLTWDLNQDQQVNVLDCAYIMASSLTPTPTPQPGFQPPQVVSQFQFPSYNVYFQALETYGDYLFGLATISDIYDGIHIFNIQDKSNIQHIDWYSTPLSSAYVELDPISQKLFISNNTTNDILVFSIADPLHLQQIDSISIDAYQLKLFPAQNLLLAKGKDDQLYVINLNDYSQIASYDFNPDDIHCTPQGYIEHIDLIDDQHINIDRSRGFCPPSSYTERNYLFRAENTANGPSLTFIKELPSNLSGQTMVQNGIGYKTNNSLTSLTRSYANYFDPVNPYLLGTFETLDSSPSVTIDIWNQNLLVYEDDGIFDYYDVSTPSQPKELLRNTQLDTYVSFLWRRLDDRAVALPSGYVYFANGRGGILTLKYQLNL